jgi:hypothetical protein
MLAAPRVLDPIVLESLYSRPQTVGPVDRIRDRRQTGRRVGAGQSCHQLERRRQLWNGRCYWLPAFVQGGGQEGRPVVECLEFLEKETEAGVHCVSDGQHWRADVAHLVVLIGPQRGPREGDVDVAYIEVGVVDVERIFRGIVFDRRRLLGAQSGLDQLARIVLRQVAVLIGEEGQQAGLVVFVRAFRPNRVGCVRQQRILKFPKLSAVILRIGRGRRRCVALVNLDVFVLPPFGVLVLRRRLHGCNQLSEQRDRYLDRPSRRDPGCRIDVESIGDRLQVSQRPRLTIRDLADRQHPDVRARGGRRAGQARLELGENIPRGVVVNEDGLQGGVGGHDCAFAGRPAARIAAAEQDARAIARFDVFPTLFIAHSPFSRRGFANDRPIRLKTDRRMRAPRGELALADERNALLFPINSQVSATGLPQILRRNPRWLVESKIESIPCAAVSSLDRRGKEPSHGSNLALWRLGSARNCSILVL